MRVLVAEDSAMMRRLLVESLKKWQYEVVEVEDGAEAWARFQEDRYPLVLSDWMMPGMDGLELINRIRSSDSAAYTYIILLTAKAGTESRLTGLEQGADELGDQRRVGGPGGGSKDQKKAPSDRYSSASSIERAALLMVDSILPRCRTMPSSFNSRSTSRLVKRATLSKSK